jgi:uncharacterized protein (TIGR03437 family)
MTRKFVSFTLALLACAGAEAATINTTLTVNATGAVGATVSVTGTATLSGGIGSGTFSAALDLGTFKAPFTITLTSGTTGTITGVITVPTSILTTGTGTGSATVTGGTGTYAGATGSFPSLAGSGGVTASGGITVTFSGDGTITTGGGGGPAGPPPPSITAVLDAGSYTRNIAQGSIFVVKGTNLSASGFTQLSFPLPATSGGVKITFAPVAGGAGTDAWLVYLFNQNAVNQLAAVLPSTVAAGSYNVTVTYNGTASAPFAATVVQRKLGLITADSTGTGLAVIQNFVSQSQLDIDRLTTFSSGGFTFSPSKPGQVLISWATGIGPVTGGDNTASPGFDFTKNGVDVKVIVGGVSIAPLYAGRAPGLAGADQINFQLPANVPTGCAVSFQVSVNNVLSNPATIAIAPDANAAACVLPGFTTSQLQKFDQGGTFTVGSFELVQLSETVPSISPTPVKFDTVAGEFIQFTGFQLAGVGQFTNPSAESCQVIHSVSGSQTPVTTAGVGGGAILLDAGAITLNGPPGSNITNLALKQDATNIYTQTIGTEGLPPGIPGLGGGNGTIVAGTYTLAGTGGTGVGKFNASVTLGSPLTITGGLPSAITRSAGLTLNWTGGNAADLVEIVGASSTTTGTGTNTSVDVWTFVCTTTAGQKTFTVPASILTQLPAVAANGIGLLEVISAGSPTAGNGSFTAPLTAGGSIDFGSFLSLIGVGTAPAYQ